jgi:hypothetical protein
MTKIQYTGLRATPESAAALRELTARLTGAAGKRVSQAQTLLAACAVGTQHLDELVEALNGSLPEGTREVRDVHIHDSTTEKPTEQELQAAYADYESLHGALSTSDSERAVA